MRRERRRGCVCRLPASGLGELRRGLRRPGPSSGPRVGGSTYFLTVVFEAQATTVLCELRSRQRVELPGQRHEFGTDRAVVLAIRDTPPCALLHVDPADAASQLGIRSGAWPDSN